MAADKKKDETEVIRFTKEQFLKSMTYMERRDALTVLLEDGKEYSKEEVNEILDEFYGKKEA